MRPESEPSSNNSRAKTSSSCQLSLKAPIQIRGDHVRSQPPSEGFSSSTCYPRKGELCKRPAWQKDCPPCTATTTFALQMRNHHTSPVPKLWHIQHNGQASSLLSSHMFCWQRCSNFLQAMKRNCFQTSLLLVLFFKPRQPAAVSKAGLTTSLQQLSGKELLPASSSSVTSPHLLISQDFISH